MNKPKWNFITLAVIALFALGQFALLSNILAPSCTNQQRIDDDLSSPANINTSGDRNRYQLANIESGGFFTDIDQADWERLKQRIRTKQDHANAGIASGAVTDPAKFYQNACETYILY